MDETVATDATVVTKAREGERFFNSCEESLALAGIVLRGLRLLYRAYLVFRQWFKHDDT